MVCTLIDNGKLANQFARLTAIVVKNLLYQESVFNISCTGNKGTCNSSCCEKFDPFLKHFVLFTYSGRGYTVLLYKSQWYSEW